MRIAFLTLEDRGRFVIDDALAVDALARRGCEVEEIPWRRDADWRAFRAVVVRSTWDYQKDAEAFLRALERISAVTPLWNPLEVIRWNLRKTYLRDLAGRGVRIVPTRFGRGMTHDDLRAIRERGASQVLKPVVSANADDTFVLDERLSDDELRAIAGKFVERDWMLQPFVPSILEEGEHSLFYFGKRYSHAIRKRPAAGDFRVQEEHGGRIEAQEPAADLRAQAETIVAAVEGPLLQARVDVVRLEDGSPALMELELIEPSLYFRTDPGAPGHFADALLVLCGAR